MGGATSNLTTGTPTRTCTCMKNAKMRNMVGLLGGSSVLTKGGGSKSRLQVHLGGDLMSRMRMLCAFFFVTCGCGSGQSEANRRGVGAECAMTSDCTESGQVCLTQFKGGYCGVSGCTHDTNCPQGSACVTDDNQINYCFLI